MDKKINISITAILSVVAFFFPNLPSTIRIIIFLVAIVISLSMALWNSQKQLKAKINEYNDVSAKHKALAHQFDLKTSVINKYKLTMQNIYYSICIAQQSDNDEKLNILLDQFVSLQKYLNDGGNSNDTE